MDPRIRLALELIQKSAPSLDGFRCIARSVNLSESRLRHLMKAEVGLPPGRYFKFQRLNCARQLLEGTFLSVKEITYKAGFSDVSHFVRDFKKAFGFTPRNYRLSAQFKSSIPADS